MTLPTQSTINGANSNNITPQFAGHTTQASARKTLSEVASGTSSTVVFNETPRPADALVDSVGVTTHFAYAGTPYWDQYSAVRSLLMQSRIRHIRDAVRENLYADYYAHITDLAAQGIHTNGVTLMNDPVSAIIGQVASLPGVYESIEGPNEYDLSGDPNWVTKVQSYQRSLYSGLKASSVTAALPVIGPSLTSTQACNAVGNISASLDRGNVHSYYEPNDPNANMMALFSSCATMVSASKPVASTETGYEDVLGNPNYVSPAIKSRYLLRTILEQWNAGMPHTYIYELVDEGGQNYGLVSANLTPKMAYWALTNFLAKLADPSGSFTIKPLSYSLTSGPNVHHALVQKHDGTYRLLLWLETAATDPVAQQQAVTVQTATKIKGVTQYEFQDSGNVSTTALTQATDGSINLTISDHVTEVKLAP